MSEKAKAHNWAKVAARNIMADLKDRGGIGNEIEACDDDIQDEIQNEIEALILKANREATADANSTFP